MILPQIGQVGEAGEIPALSRNGVLIYSMSPILAGHVYLFTRGGTLMNFIITS